METRQGKSVFSGVAIGKLFVYKKAKQVVDKKTIEDPAAEVARYMAAKEKAKEQLESLGIRDLKPTTTMSELPVGRQQMVEIAKA